MYAKGIFSTAPELPIEKNKRQPLAAIDGSGLAKRLNSIVRNVDAIEANICANASVPVWRGRRQGKQS